MISDISNIRTALTTMSTVLRNIGAFLESIADAAPSSLTPAFILQGLLNTLQQYKGFAVGFGLIAFL